MMFRLLYNAPQSLRPALLKVRSGLNPQKSAQTPGGNPSQLLQQQRSITGTPGQQPRTKHNNNHKNNNNNNNNRNSRQAGHQGRDRPSVIDSLNFKSPQDPIILEALNHEYRRKLDYFDEQLALAFQYYKNPKLERELVACVHNTVQLMDEDLFRPLLSTKDLNLYLSCLNNATFAARSSRLRSSRNRDSDNYNNANLQHDVMLKTALIKMSEWIAQGEFKEVLNELCLRNLFYTMLQFKLQPEMIQLWENGVNDEVTGKLYLGQLALAVILKVAFEEGRFTYEEVLQIFETTQKKVDNNNENKNSSKISHELLSSIGRISIAAGDYSRGLDSLESLLAIFESQPRHRNLILHSLAELHLAFIGSCKDLTIAQHFFDKIVDGNLPYKVRLKVPYVHSLLENCYELDAPFEKLEYFWKRTIDHYNVTSGNEAANSRYSNLNNAFFGLFFKKYPQLTEESHEKLKLIISTYTNTKVVDEIFLNTVISNYSWNDKQVLEQLMQSYSVYNVKRTPVSYRICLKKTGMIQEYTSEEILNKWNESLQFLDDQKFSYIPIADWAALRDSTILSQYSTERKNLYLAVADKYKDYIQDYRTCVRFCKHWLKQLEHFRDIRKLSDPNNSFECDVSIEIPQFLHLRKNIDFNVLSREILSKK